MSDVKRFWADLCVQHVEAVLYSDYAALEAELAKLRAGQEPVAFYWQDVGYKNPNRHGPYFGWPTEAALRNVDGGAIPVPLYTAPPPSSVPDEWIPVSERLPSAGQLVIASGFIFGKLENGCWVEPAIYEEDDREFHPPKPNEEGDLVADFDATMNHTNYWMPLPAAPGAAPSAPATVQGDAVCEVCDGTGDVHRPDGEWLGKCPFCDLPESPAITAAQEGGKV